MSQQERLLAQFKERRRQELEDIEFARRLQVGARVPASSALADTAALLHDARLHVSSSPAASPCGASYPLSV